MSKAFVKENDGDGGADDENDVELAAIPRGSKNYMTPACHARLRSELHELLHVTRPEIVRTVSWAASNGDRSENGDYIYGKRRLREIDRRLRFLTKRLDTAQVVDPLSQKGERVLFGATVTVEDEAGATRVVRIVGIDESDPARGKVSWISPIARALLNACEGDVVTLHTPKGEEELEIRSVQFVEIP